MLSSAGRIGRLAFLAAGAGLLAVAWAWHRLAAPTAHRWLDWGVYGLVLFSAACLFSKRLHDRGRAGWWAFVPVIAIWIAWPQPHDAFGWAAAAIALAAVLDLGMGRGQRGLNRFG